MNKFTLLIKNRGWTAKDACARWGIRYETYNKWCNDSDKHNKLTDLCNGLPLTTTSKDGIIHYLNKCFTGG